MALRGNVKALCICSWLGANEGFAWCHQWPVLTNRSSHTVSLLTAVTDADADADVQFNDKHTAEQ